MDWATCTGHRYGLPWVRIQLEFSHLPETRTCGVGCAGCHRFFFSSQLHQPLPPLPTSKKFKTTSHCHPSCVAHTKSYRLIYQFLSALQLPLISFCLLVFKMWPIEIPVHWHAWHWHSLINQQRGFQPTLGTWCYAHRHYPFDLWWQ